MTMLFIHNIHILTPQGRLENSGILIDQGKIAAIGSPHELALPLNCPLLDGNGSTAAPGYIDLQLNGGFGLDFTQNPETIWQVAAGLPRYGVTSFLPTIITSPAETTRKAQEVWRSGPPAGFLGANALGLHLEGPMLNPGKKGAHNPAYIVLPSLDVIADWTPENGVWLVTLAPEQPGALEVIAELHRRGVLVSAGHSMATYSEAELGFAAGIRKGTHLFNAQPALDHRQPGLATTILTNPLVKAGIIPDGIHVHPAMVKLAWKAKGVEGIVVVTDAMAALGMPPGEYLLGDYAVRVDETSARLANGTLAGSILTLDAAVRNMIDFCGCSLAEAVAMVTASPANLLGLTNKGRLSPGADADLVLLDTNGRILTTYIGGQLVYSQGEK